MSLFTTCQWYSATESDIHQRVLQGTCYWLSFGTRQYGHKFFDVESAVWNLQCFHVSNYFDVGDVNVVRQIEIQIILIEYTSIYTHFHNSWSIYLYAWFSENRYLVLTRSMTGLSKQYRPWSDAAFCGVWSGSILFAVQLDFWFFCC